MFERSPLTLKKTERISTPVSELLLDWLTGDIHISVISGQEIVIKQFASAGYPDKKLFRLQEGLESLAIEDGRKGSIPLGINLHKTVLFIELPARQLHRLSLRHVGGKVEAEQLDAQECLITTTSGKLQLSGKMEILAVKATGSQVRGERLQTTHLDLSATASKVNISGALSVIKANAAGRSVKLASSTPITQLNAGVTGTSMNVMLPDNNGFRLELNKRSGTFSSDFPLENKGSRYIYKEGLHVYRVEIRGGKFTIGKNNGS